MLVPSYVKYRDLRDKAGVTDYRVSMETGIPKSTFSEWKEDSVRKSAPKVDKLAKLANYFGVAIEDLLQEDQEAANT